MATVEAAFALAAIAVFLIVGAGAVAGVITQIRCTDAAREVVRLSAAGDPRAGEVGRKVAPDDARIVVTATAETVAVTVSADVPVLPFLSVSARAVGAVEPGASDYADGGADANAE
ncbi:TadE family type IV pilus minor pilin [Gordonia zhaorongruii]|uniref:TadE family type IV pilus minor pilin n=1 Tax=Gordonia zhaorongruii TaxID=2597659 RepID=UPI00104BE521|nr:TadE family type IV pilus minor pilin [Gordonia zhaorongruii]